MKYMKKYNIFLYLFSVPFFFLSLQSCNDFLDKMPDSRAEVDTQDEIEKMLVSAYPEISYIYVAELSSDNTDDVGGENNPYFDRFDKEVFNWIATDQTNNESPLQLWEACYSAASSANHALQAIEQTNSQLYAAEKAEALLARAYAHFVLVNMFCQHYDKTYAESDLGIPYAEKPETTLNPQYERGTVAEVYRKIDRDIQEALPNVSDVYYKVPKYHFNVQAAYAFAARFYLYYEDFDKAIEYATKALGAVPQNVMRDNAALALMPRDPLANVSTQYISQNSKANFLLNAHYSNLGTVYGAYYTGSRFNHSRIVSETESISLTAPWGASSTYKLRPWVYSGTNLDKTLLPRLPYIFEYTDPVAGIGYRRTVHAVFTAEETLLVRAEAYILKNRFDEALADINIWVKSSTNSTTDLTLENVNRWVTSFEYYTPDKPTPRKEIHPAFSVQQGDQENLIQLLLFMRRYETMHTGLRWFDLKRYGIVVYRRLISGAGVALVYDNPLDERDLRRAIQIPTNVIAAGIAPNPRPELTIDPASGPLNETVVLDTK
jgi:tetratricopeptide (TPR) repeat protein